MLGSGSGGNATLVSHEAGRVLIDIGLSYREVLRRLARLDVRPDTIDGIVLTHAHGDHTRGARMFSRRHDVPVYATDIVRNEWGVTDITEWRALIADESLDLVGFRFMPFEIPHDASETCGFRIETPEGVIGYATDVGALTLPLIQHFRDCCVLVIESNHATELLRVSPYARSTRERIAGPGGHLSNEALAAFIKNHLGTTVQCVVLTHLSRVNNLPVLAEMSCREALMASGRGDVEVVVATQDRPTKTIDLSTWVPMPNGQASLPLFRTL